MTTALVTPALRQVTSHRRSAHLLGPSTVDAVRRRRTVPGGGTRIRRAEFRAAELRHAWSRRILVAVRLAASVLLGTLTVAVFLVAAGGVALAAAATWVWRTASPARTRTPAAPPSTPASRLGTTHERPRPRPTGAHPSLAKDRQLGYDL